jgi:hypothetical protein
LACIKNTSTSFSPLFQFQNPLHSNYVSKNILDSTNMETENQPFHHGTTLGGSWTNPDKQLITILCSSDDPKSIQLLPKHIKDVKQKSHSPDEFAIGMSDSDACRAL